MQIIIKLLIIASTIATFGFCGYADNKLSENANNVISDNKRPHIIFIISDDMGWNDVSFHGSNQIPTPNIDALAYNGVTLNRHYVLPVCTPSRTSLLTGRYAIREGMQGFPLVPGEPRGIPLNSTLMPEYFRKLGYETNLIGKWHLGYYTESCTPARRGFDSFFGYYNGYINYFNHSIEQKVESSKMIGWDLHQDDKDGLKPAYQSKYFTDLVTDEAERIIKNNGNSRPLFLQISHLAVHAASKDILLEVRDMKEVNATFPYIKDIQRRMYAGMMKALDDSVGRVMTALSDAKMLDNSIVIFLSDNGAPTVGLYANTGSNYPLRGMKNTLFEGGVRGAACIFSPLIRASSRVSEEMMHIVDWLPTLYAAAGGDVWDIKETIDGVNQWNSLVNGVKSPRRSVLLNIDEVTGLEGAMIGWYKLVKGVAAEGKGYYGDSGNDPSYPEYRVEDALESAAGLAIKRLNGFSISSPMKAQTLRSKSRVSCKNTSRYANCSTLCLFDVLNDPCEIHDVSKQHPEVVSSLKSMLDDYHRVLMPQTNAPVDPCANPDYFNNTWMPWINNLSTCQYPQVKFL